MPVRKEEMSKKTHLSLHFKKLEEEEIKPQESRKK